MATQFLLGAIWSWRVLNLSFNDMHILPESSNPSVSPYLSPRSFPGTLRLVHPEFQSHRVSSRIRGQQKHTRLVFCPCGGMIWPRYFTWTVHHGGHDYVRHFCRQMGQPISHSPMVLKGLDEIWKRWTQWYRIERSHISSVALQFAYRSPEKARRWDREGRRRKIDPGINWGEETLTKRASWF